MILSDEKMEQLEVIVVNDGSPDASAQVAQKYVDQYPGTFCVLNKENGGHGSGINAGVRQARGKYFKVIDADDWVDTKALEETMEILAKEDFDALVQSYRTFDISTMPPTIKSLDIRYPNRELHPDYIYNFEELMSHREDVAHCMTFHGITYNTQFYRDQHYDMPEKVFYEDQEYSTIPLCRAERIRLLRTELYIYRIGDVNQSVSSQSMLKRLDHFLTVEKRMLDFEPQLKKCPKGAYDFWVHKMSKFVTDIYRVMLIRSEDKAKYRKDAAALTKEIKEKAPRLYEAIKKKYLIFRSLNRMHVSDEMYQKMLDQRKPRR